MYMCAVMPGSRYRVPIQWPSNNVVVPLASQAYFLPIILKNMGWSKARAILLVCRLILRCYVIINFYFAERAAPWCWGMYTQYLEIVSHKFLTQVITLLVAYLSDKYKHRSTFIVVFLFVCVTGTSLLAFSEQNTVRYAGKFSFCILTFLSKAIHRCFFDDCR